MEKKNAFVTTIGFNRNDPIHVVVAELLNSMRRGKAQYIVNAVLAYQGRELGESMIVGHPPDYERIRSFVLQVIEEHERQKRGFEEITGIPEDQKKMEVSGDIDFGFDDVAVEGIMASLEAFKI